MSSTRKSLKPPPPPPPRPSGRFEDIKAAKETYSDLTYQIRRLNELYNQLTPQNGNRRASSSSSRDHQDGAQRDPKALQQLRELKANLRKDYGHPRDIPRLERLKVVVMFDDHKKPFFDIRLRPFSGYPRGYPFLIDDSEGTIAGLSVAIYQKVLKAVQEEGEAGEEEEQFRGFGEGNHNHNNDRHAAEDLLEPVNIKQEIVDEEEEEGEELITLEDDSEEEPFNNELQQEENYNSQVVIPPPAATDNSAAIVMPENGPAALANHPQANIDVAPSQLPQPPQLPPTPQPLPHNNNNNSSSSSNNNNNTAEQQRQQSAVSGSTVSQGQSSEAPSIKLEPADSSIVNIGRVSHPPSNQAPQTGHNEAPASSVAVPPPPAAAAAGASPAAAKESSSSNIRVLRMNPPSTSNTNVGPPRSKPQQQQQQQLPHPNNNNNSNNITKTSAQQLQQQPPAADVSAAAAAAAVAERRTLTMTPTANSSIFHIVGNNKRPGEHSNAAQPAQPQDNPKRPKVAAAAAGTPSSSLTSTSTQASKATLRAIADRFLASAAFLKAADTVQLPCPICEKKYAKAAVKDHMDMLHICRFQYVPYHCTYPGCTYFNVWELNALSHVKQVHGCRHNPEQYLVKRAAGAAAGAAGAVVPRTPGASGSAAAAKRATTTTTTPTTAATTSTPPTTASTTHQQHRPPSTSTPTTAAAAAAAAAAIAFSAVTAANVEEYLRAHCPSYVAAKNVSTRVKCPQCSKSPYKYQLKDHLLSLHCGLKPYRCRWQDCSFTTGWRSSAAAHLKEVHKSSRQAEFIVFQEEAE